MEGEKYSVRLADLEYYLNLINCQAACPAHTDARGYVNAIIDGNYLEAYITARQPNPLASTCARVCNARCEANCRRGLLDAPVSIRALKRFLTEQYGVEAGMSPPLTRVADWEQGTELLSGKGPGNSNTFESLSVLRLGGIKAEPNRDGQGRKVAVIGSGPAGLACAHDMAVLGYEVTIFEASPVAGGMLVLGVPEYRLPRDLVRREIQAVEELGVELRLNTRLGRDFALQDLREEGYEAIFIAIGAHKSRDLRIEGIEFDGVLRAVDFLLNVNLGYRVDLGERVAVIGGGNVAIDVARTAARFAADDSIPRSNEDLTTAVEAARAALRLGAKEVHVFCLESRDEMPADDEEVGDALAEGIVLHTRLGPNRILDRGGQVSALETIAVERAFDETGRFNPQFRPGSESLFPADSVIVAVGQGSDLSFIREEDGLEVTQRGTLAVDQATLATTAPGIFTGGDVAFGPRIIIEAVRDGHTAARSIHQYLQRGQVEFRRRGRMTPVTPDVHLKETSLNIPRRRPQLLPVDRRIGVAEVEQGYTETEAVEQANRCLRCHIQTVFNGDLCILCGACVDICPEFCLKLVHLDEIRGDEGLSRLVEARLGQPLGAYQEGGTNLQPLSEGMAMIKDEDRCLRCGLCAQRCPVGAITMEALSFEEELVPVRAAATNRASVGVS